MAASDPDTPPTRMAKDPFQSGSRDAPCDGGEVDEGPQMRFADLLTRLNAGSASERTSLRPSSPQSSDPQSSDAQSASPHDPTHHEQGTPNPTGGDPNLPLDWSTLSLKGIRDWSVERAERAYLDRLLRDESGHLARVAQRAGICPRSLYDRMKKYQLKKEEYR